eukprot:scaffold5493_cov166-Cylindrotheca_fusiformis.AAC.1
MILNIPESSNENSKMRKVKTESDLTALTCESSDSGCSLSDFTSSLRSEGSLRSCLKSSNNNNNNDSERSSCSLDASVRFSHVQIREYPICIGDNPSTTEGPPISLGWEYDEEKEIPVDENEQKKRRSLEELTLSNLKRMARLHSCGYDKAEIKKAIMETNVERDRRQETVDGLKNQKAHERFESMKRAVLNATFKRAQKKRERDLLKPYKSATAIEA